MNLSKNNQSGFVLLGVLVIVLFLSIMVGAAMINSQSQLKFSDERVQIHEAFYAAQGGIGRAIFELRSNPDWGLDVSPSPILQDIRLNRVENDNATTISFYTVSVADGGILNGFPTRWVKASGRNIDQKVGRNIYARLIVENPARFLISSLGDIHVGSGANVEADMLAKNFNFDVNNSLPQPARNINVHGDIFHLEKAFVNGVQVNNAAEAHNQNSAIIFDQGNEILNSPSITFTGVDLDRYRHIAQSLQSSKDSYYTSGNVTVNLDHLSDLNGGNSFTPQIIFADGDINIRGDYSHSLLVVAGKNLYINGRIVPKNGVNSRPQVGLFAKRDVIIPSGTVGSGGNLDLEAFIVADGGDQSEGVFKAEGGLNSLGTLNFTGAISARGKGRTAGDLNAFQSRNYTYNPDLTQNRRIPFLPFIVNLVRWQEEPPNPNPFP